MSNSVEESLRRVAPVALIMALLVGVPSLTSAIGTVDPLAVESVLGTELGIGTAFDGTHLWYTLGYAVDVQVYTKIFSVDPLTGEPGPTLDMMTMTEGRTIIPGGLAWDTTTGHLWVATMIDVDAFTNDNAPGMGEIFEIDPEAGVILSSFPTFEFTAMDGEPMSGVIDGLAYDSQNDTLWFSPWESLHVYEVAKDGALRSSFALPFPEEIWNAGIAFDGNHLWLSLRTGGMVRDVFPGFAEIAMAEFTREGELLRGFLSESDPIAAEDLAYDAVSFAPACVVWVASLEAPLQALEIPCPLQLQATASPGDVLSVEKEILLDPLATGGILDPTVTVSWEVACEPAGLTVSLSPESYTDVAVGATLAFTETLEVSPEAQPGDYHCIVTFLVTGADGIPRAFEEQHAWIVVEAAPEEVPPDETPDEGDHVAFQKFKVFWMTLEDDEIEMKGKFRLAEASDGIDLSTEDVMVTVGDFSVTIPAGSFQRSGHKQWTFEGEIDGITVEMVITKRADGKYKFTFEAETEGLDLGEFSNPIEVTLTIGDDFGTRMAYGHIGWDDGDHGGEGGEQRRRWRQPPWKQGWSPALTGLDPR